MSICGFKGCQLGNDGKRFSGSAQEVHEHEVTAHGKPRSGRTKGEDIVLPGSPNLRITGTHSRGPKVRCHACEDVIQSQFRHDFQRCKCGAIFVDGGRECLRIGWPNGMDPSKAFTVIGGE